MSNPTTPEKKPSPFASARTPAVSGAFPLDAQGLLNQPDPKPMMSSSSLGKGSAAPAKAPVQNSSGDRISGTIPKIEPKLIGQDNYTEWINKLEMTLFLYELTYKEESYWDIVTGYSTEPTEKEYQREWKRANYFCMLVMCKNAEEEPHNKISLFKDAHQGYKALQSAYEGKTVTDLGTVVNEVMKITYDDRSTTIEDHISNYDKKWGFMRSTITGMTANQAPGLDADEKLFQSGIRDLAASGKAKAEFLMMTLPPFYAPLVENLRLQQGFTYGDVTRNLIRYVPGRQGASRRITANGGAQKGSTPGNPIVLRTEPGKDRFGKPLDTSKTCGYCIKVKKWKGIGHTESECNTKKRERGAGGSGGQHRAGHIEPYVEDEFGTEEGGVKIGRLRINMIKRVSTFAKHGYYEYDTGAQVHTTNELWRLTNRTPEITITAANGTRTKAEYSGTLSMTHQGREITLKGVLYHPKFYNLISGQKLGDHTTRSVGTNMEVRLPDGNLRYKIERDANGTMWIKPDGPQGPNSQPTKVVSLKVNKVTLQDLHERYGHISYSSLLSLPEAKKVIDLGTRTCNPCLYGKSTQPGSKENPKPIRTQRVFERVYADLIGPLPKQWLRKSYILTAMDDYSRFCTAIPIKDKREASEKLKEWVLAMEVQTGKRTAHLQTDEGKEFLRVKAWGVKKGITPKETIPYHEETHAAIERLNRTLQDMARTAMIGADMRGLWGDAIQWAAYTKNRIPHRSLGVKTPIEVLLGKPAVRDNLRPFGQRVMAHLYKEQRPQGDKMAPRVIEARVIGYTNTHNVYQTITETGKRMLSKEPRTMALDHEDEEETNEQGYTRRFTLEKAVEDLHAMAEGKEGPNFGSDCPVNPVEAKTPEKSKKGEEKKPDPTTPSNQLLQEAKEAPVAPRKLNVEPRRSQRSGRDLRPIDPKTHERIGEKTQSYEEQSEPWYSHFLPRINRVGHDEDHPTEQQANSSPHAQEWAQARETERAKLRQYGVYTIVPKPEGHRPVDTKWVYDVKRDQIGNLLRRRARKVGRGFTQEKGVNYGETFSQMSRSETWRILLTLAIQKTPQMAIRQWDVKAAYLQAPLQHEVYVQDINEKGEIKYWKLHKALYGLKQAGHEWYQTMKDIMVKTAGLTQSIGDPGCFYKNGLILSTHVDDMIAIAETEEELDQLEKDIETHVELDKLGVPKKLLGMELTWEGKGTVKLTQKTAIGNLAKEFGVTQTIVPSKSLPMNLEMFKEPQNEEEVMTNEGVQQYQSLVGSLLYIARHTRPEISIHVNLLGRRTSKPSQVNLQAGLQVIRYLISTKENGLTIQKEATMEECINIQGFADASYGGERSRSQSGSLILLYNNPITWSSRRQDTVAMSITEAEYIACSETAKDIRWLQQLLQEITPQKDVPAVIFVDNEAAIKLTKTQTFHRRSKHIEHRHHFIREMVDRKLITMKGIAGKENPADPLTKLLPMSMLMEWTKKICLRN